MTKRNTESFVDTSTASHNSTKLIVNVLNEYSCLNDFEEIPAKLKIREAIEGITAGPRWV